MRTIHRLSGVYRTYGDTVTLALTDIEIPDGKIIVLRGPSGCRKSTLVRIINGLIATDSGEVKVSGEAITPDTARRRRRRMECVIPEGGLFPHMTASRNLTLMARRPSLLCYCAAFLPSVWNTQAGLLGIDPAIIESARDIVPAEGVKLLQLELPLATRSIMARANTSAVINSAPPRWAP